MTRTVVNFFLLALATVVAGLPAAALAQEAPKVPIEALPEKPPAWLAGYRVRYALRVVEDPAKLPGKTVMASLPTGGWLKPDGSDVAVQNAAGQPIPVTVRSHDPNGETIIQFARSGNDKWYWAYASNPAAAPAAGPDPQEGLVAEYRQWAGDDIDTWAQVAEGLNKSDNVIGNAPLAEVIANYSPAKPHEPRHVAGSYRGFLNIKTAGEYRLLVNAQDAAFLFVDGKMVYERGGANERLTGKLPFSTTGNLINLTAGVHPFEIHHVVGNNRTSFGYCAFFWVPPGAKEWAYVPPEAFAQPLYTTVASVEEASGGPIATFAWGIDDILTTFDQTLYLVRFEAQGTVKDPAKLTWDFGDGTTGTGASVTHVYFKDGPHPVKLTSSPGLPAAQRTIKIWNTPVRSSPLSLGAAVKALAAIDWKKLDLPRIRQMHSFLLVCEQPDRWPLLEAMSRHLLAQKGEDPASRATAYVSLMEALAQQGKGADALQQVDAALKEFAKLPSLQVRIQLAAGDVNARHLREVETASRIYRSIIEDHRRVEIPEVRMAAIRLGDLYASVGEMPEAAEAYRLAGTLGGAAFEGSAQTDAITRGASLRIAEQRLRAGDIRQTRQLMDKIEITYPEQKLDGLYRFFRAETDRIGGRYEEAVDHYQVLLKLPQWSGYRDKAVFGIADSYFRAGDYERSLEWLDTLEQSFPAYYDAQKIADYRKAVEIRGARARRDGAGFEPFLTSFEPGDALGQGIEGWSIVPGLGMGGTHVGLIEEIPPTKTNANWEARLRNLTSNGYYFVELWYRSSLNSLPVGSHIHAKLFGTGTDINPDGGAVRINFGNSHGEWRKFGFLLRAPVTQDGRVTLSVVYVAGAMEIDALRVMPVSDRQYDAMVNFVEGTSEP